MELSAKVISAIDRFFPEADKPIVAELLATYGDAPYEREVERVRLLILKISRLDVGRVRSLVKLAKGDYRDLIAGYEQPNRTYIVGILHDGPNAGPGSKESLEFASLQKWKKAGQIVIGGQFPKDPDARGLYIFTVDSIEAAQALVNEDPSIQSGHLRFEFHQWLTADGLQVGVPRHYLDIDVS